MIKEILIQALTKTANESTRTTSKQHLHRERSKNFVEAVASSLQEHYINNPAIKVLSKHNTENKSEFGLNELLYDVLVCETDMVSAAKKRKELRYVTKAIWEIESEFAEDSQEAIWDFNKLVLGSSENKLFIGPQVHDNDIFLSPLIALAKYCNSNTYVALIPHPSKWGKTKLEVLCWKFINNNWEKI